MLKLCQRSGCMGVLIGFETLSAETMRSIGRKSRLRMDYLDAIQRIHDHGIGIDGSFVFGFDTDDDGRLRSDVGFRDPGKDRGALLFRADAVSRHSLARSPVPRKTGS